MIFDSTPPLQDAITRPDLRRPEYWAPRLSQIVKAVEPHKKAFLAAGSSVAAWESFEKSGWLSS